jgi:hypothetical protein
MNRLPALATAAVLAIAPASHAAPAAAPPPAAKPPPISIAAAPIFGQDAPVGSGWYDVLVRVDNPQATAQKGVLELRVSQPWDNERPFVSRAPYNVPAGKTAYVRLLAHSLPEGGSGEVHVRARDDKGAELLDVQVPVNTADLPVLVDVHEPSRLSVALRGWPASIRYSPTPTAWGYGSTPGIGFAAPSFDRATGDPLLPERKAGYGGVSVVLMPTDVLTRLQGDALDALVSWVAGGGTLALVPMRPEDLRNPTVAALAGGEPRAIPTPPALLALPTIPRPGGTGTMVPPVVEPEDEGIGFDGETGAGFQLLPTAPAHGRGGPFLPMSTSRRGGSLGPRPATVAKMSGYEGGSLVQTAHGATSTYGLGEVVFLSYDPSQAPGVDDPWVQGRVASLVEHAWERRANIAFPPGSIPRHSWRTDEMRRALDPNENFRPGLGFAAIVLAVYSVVVGPITFMRSRKKGDPLLPLRWAPVWSAAAFGAIVIAGLAVKGWTGRSRRVSLVEIGAGFTRGAVRRYRGFFTSETRALKVGATDAASVLDVVTGDGVLRPRSVLAVDRDGIALDEITSLPWQTLVVREDGHVDLPGSIAVLDTGGSGIDVVNHTGKVLKDVVVYVPGDAAHYFAAIPDGGTVSAANGTVLFTSATRRAGSAGSRIVHTLDVTTLASPVLDEVTRDRMEATWRPVESAADDSVDWWPDDAPVVLAELDGADHPRTDGGLRVESDKVLLRVVGYGGAR